MPLQKHLRSCSKMRSERSTRCCRIAVALSKQLCFITVLLIIFGVTADAFASRNLTLYLDGAEVEELAAAKNGYLEINLPSGADKESLRIAPGKGAEIVRVLTEPRRPGKNIEKELDQLADREEQLHARLKALSVREEIFKAAAKSQSGKAPRRTKTDPDPLVSIKKGTDYAIAQLEAVYQAMRKAEKELAQLADRRSRIKSDGLSGGTIVRVWARPAAAGLLVTWRESGRSWTPYYQIRATDNGRATVSLMAQRVSLGKGEKARLVLAPLVNKAKPAAYNYQNDWAPLLREEFRVSSVSESPYTFSFANGSGLNFPAGEISCFNNGVYVGKGYFQGVNSGSQAEIVCSGR